MMVETKNVVDVAKVGKKGFPRHYQALGINPPMKEISFEESNPSTPQEPPSENGVPTRVTANQFGKQLVVLGILDQVQDWVDQQDKATQWSFNRSATFVREDPMMQTGFTSLGFTTEQIDQFFIAASKL